MVRSTGVNGNRYPIPTMPPCVSTSSTRMLRLSPNACPFIQGDSGQGRRSNVVRSSRIVMSPCIAILRIVASSAALADKTVRRKTESPWRAGAFSAEMTTYPDRDGLTRRILMSRSAAAARTVRLPFVAMLLGLPVSGCGVNNIPSYEEQAKAKWSEVQNQYQRRADLIPNLVETVRGYARQERETLEAVTNRSEEHTSELQSLRNLVCRLMLEKKNTQ